MKVTPIISADVEEYPELRRLLNMTLRPVVDIMGAHAISSIRRIHKTGVFDHPYDKDLVVPLGIPGVPESVRASQYTVGKALLDYLSAIGVAGLTIEAGQDDLQGLVELWQPRTAEAPQASCRAPSPAAAQDSNTAEPEKAAGDEPAPSADTAETKNKEEHEDGEQ